MSSVPAGDGRALKRWILEHGDDAANRDAMKACDMAPITKPGAAGACGKEHVVVGPEVPAERAKKLTPAESTGTAEDVLRCVSLTGGRSAHRGGEAVRAPARPMAAYDQTMADKLERGGWTPEEVKREEDAQRARVRRDAAGGLSRNLETRPSPDPCPSRIETAGLRHNRRAPPA